MNLVINKQLFANYFWWLVRGGMNQGFPVLFTLYMASKGQDSEVVSAAAIFVVVTCANLLRSGAIQYKYNIKHQPSFFAEILNGLLWTLPLALTALFLQSNNYTTLILIFVISSVSGVFASHLENLHSIAKIAKIDSGVFLCIFILFFSIFDLESSSLYYLYLVREVTFLIILLLYLKVHSQYLYNFYNSSNINLLCYVKLKFSSSFYWCVPSLKDILLTNVAIKLFSQSDFSKYHSSTIFWCLPILVIGLLSRINFKLISESSKNNKLVFIISLIVVIIGSGISYSISFYFPQFRDLNPALILAISTTLILSPFVTVCTISFAAYGLNRHTLVQHFLWIVGPISIYYYSPFSDLTTLATASTFANILSLYSIFIFFLISRKS